MKRYCILFALLLFFTVPLFAQEESADTEPLTEMVHVVEYGDTLYRIALRYGVTVNDLATHNDIQNTWQLQLGQQIRIPGLESPDMGADVVNNPLVAAAPTIHIVQYGESLGQIAAFYGIPSADIMRANNINNPNLIIAGSELRIWTPETVEAEVAAEAAQLEADAGNTPAVDEMGDSADPETSAETDDSAEATTTDDTEATNASDDSAEAATTDDTEAVTTNDDSAATTDDTETSDADDVAVTDDEAEELNEITETDENATTEDEETVTDETEAADDEEEPFIIHTVAPGEYLSTIASRYGVPWMQIAAANDILNPNSISLGAELIIPGVERDPETGEINYFMPEVDMSPPGAHWGEGREIIVLISQQKTYAYEDGELVKEAIVSTGLPVTPTVRGEFAVTRKYETQTMVGPGYYLPDVESVMYFYGAYAFHQAYWHDNFGQPMSYGCVNMTTEDAKWFFDFADIGTNVLVRF